MEADILWQPREHQTFSYQNPIAKQLIDWVIYACLCVIPGTDGQIVWNIMKIYLFLKK